MNGWYVQVLTNLHHLTPVRTSRWVLMIVSSLPPPSILFGAPHIMFPRKAAFIHHTSFWATLKCVSFEGDI